MTVENNSPVSGPIITDGISTQFPFSFKIVSASHMVLRITDADGQNAREVTVGLTVDPQYIGSDNGGYVTYIEGGAPLPAGLKVYPFRNVPYEQPNRIGNQGRFFPETHENTFDLIEMQVQQVNEKVGRALVVDVGTEPPDLQSIFDAEANSVQSALAAADSAEDAQLSEDASLLYANNASGSATLAQRFATYPEDTDIPGTGGLRSAYHWALKAMAVVVGGVQAAIHAAPAKTAVDDADELALADSAAAWALKKFTLANLITSIFKLTRTIPNAVFASATFAWKNAGGFAASINTTAHTAARNILWPDRDINLGNVPLAPKFKGAPTEVTLGGLVTQPHGFGVVPYTYSAWARCKVAVEGFSVGDEVPAIGIVNSGGSPLGGQVYADATNVYIRVSNAFVVYVHNKTTGAASSGASLSATNWDMFTKAESY